MQNAMNNITTIHNNNSEERSGTDGIGNDFIFFYEDDSVNNNQRAT